MEKKTFVSIKCCFLREKYVPARTHYTVGYRPFEKHRKWGNVTFIVVFNNYNTTNNEQEGKKNCFRVYFKKNYYFYFKLIFY